MTDKANIELLDGETLGVRFAYDAGQVAQLRGLKSRRWNPEKKRWEVHLAHLADVMRIFYLHPDDISPEILEQYRNSWISCRLRLKLTHSRVQLSGSNLPVKDLDKATSFPVQGHQYSLKFIKGQWDGRRHLLNKKDYSAPAGLLNRIQAVLDQAEVEYELQDEREWPQASLTFRRAKKVKLRDYQQAAITEALEQHRGVLELATGAGKTMVAAQLIKMLCRPALFFVHTKDLLHQAREMLTELLGCPIGQLGDGVIDLQPITVATIQTTVRALGGKLGKAPDGDALAEDETKVAGKAEAIIEAVETTPVVFFDECHHLPADTCYAVAMRTQAAGWRYGLSATPYRTDRHDLLIEAALGPKICRANASHLIDTDYLVAPRIIMHTAPIYQSAKRVSDYQKIYRSYIVENDARNRLVAQAAAELSEQGKSVLVLVAQIEHGERLKKLIPGAKFMQGADNSGSRQKTLNSLRTKKLKVLIATTLADEGLDIPSLDAVILAGAGKSETRALQRIGRALRTCKGKKDATIIDFFDQAPYLKEQSMRRLDIYKTEPRFLIETRGFA